MDRIEQIKQTLEEQQGPITPQYISGTTYESDVAYLLERAQELEKERNALRREFLNNSRTWSRKIKDLEEELREIREHNDDMDKEHKFHNF